MEQSANLIISNDGSLNSYNTASQEYYASIKEGALSEKIAKHIAPAWEFLYHRAASQHTLASHLTSHRPIRSIPHHFTSHIRQIESSSQHTLESCVDSKIKLYVESSLDSSKSNAQTTQIPQTPQGTQEVRILDLCFGLGYCAMLSSTLAHNHTIYITSLECDRSVLDSASIIHNLSPATRALLAQGESINIARNVFLRIIWGDATTTLRALAHNTIPNTSQAQQQTQDAFDIIYQDPFSYEKSPQLWSAEHFALLYHLSKPECLITTYATREEVIRHATQAGFLAYRYKADSALIEHITSTLHHTYSLTHTQATLPIHARKFRRSSSLFSKQVLQFKDTKTQNPHSLHPPQKLKSKSKVNI